MKPLASALLACGAILMGSTALAQAPDLSVGQCESLSYAPNGDAVAYCNLTNPSDAPVARLKAVVSLQHPAHDAPIASHIVEFDVPGGVDSQETNMVPFPHKRGADLPPSPKFHTMVEVIDAWDYEGNPLFAGAASAHEPEMQTAEVSRQPLAKVERPSAPIRKSADRVAMQSSAAAAQADEQAKPKAARRTSLSKADRATLAEEIKACWKVNLRSEIANITLLVQFDLDEDGQLIGDVETVQTSDADERVVWDAYMAARRAILRCQGDGFSIAAPASSVRMIFGEGRVVEVL